jgi:hypothetical protein
VTLQLGQGEGKEVEDRAPAREGLGDGLEEQEVVGAREDEAARLVMLVDEDLNVREEVGGPLGFVEDHGARKLGQESPGILEGKGPLIGEFQGDVGMVPEGVPDEGGFPRLPGSRQGYDGETGRGLPQSGRQGSGDHRPQALMPIEYCIFIVHPPPDRGQREFSRTLEEEAGDAFRVRIERVEEGECGQQFRNPPP